ncbi:MAG: cell division protein FtsW [Caulobacterales bacterium]|nr:cell division protein FtsW [Caulobacterales bacterium]MCA0371234.1 putative lipid II flippase FtsW [Pseudomonadota bacterium]
MSGKISPFGLSVKIKQWWDNIDHVSFILVCLLISIGVILSFGSSVTATEDLHIQNQFYFVYKQTAFALIGFSILIFLSNLSIDNIRRTTIILYLIAFAILVSILVFGHSAKGAQRWLKIGGFGLQPSEIIKPCAIVLVAWVLTRRIYDKEFKGELLAIALVALPISIFLLQPDVGQTLLLTIAFVSTFWIAGIGIKWIIGISGVAMAGVIALFSFMPHVISRWNKFIDPNNNDNYQVERALDAISNGDFFGKGAGEGVIKHLLPDAHTDFIFSLATEEWGFLGALVLISLFAILVIRGIHIASKNPDPFAQVAGIGIYTLFGLQVGINLAVNLNIIPAKGMTLPFISYGGSSLLGSAITMGLAIALTRRRPVSSILGI